MTAPHAIPITKGKLWTSRILGGFAILFLVFDTAMKLFKMAPAIEATSQLGYPEGTILAIGVIELVCLLAYVVPRTSVLGAVLLTGYLGGAVSTHVRVGNPLFSHVLFPIYVGAMIWGALLLRDSRLRELFPLRSE